MTLVKTFVMTCDDCGITISGYPKETFLNRCRRWGWLFHNTSHRCPECCTKKEDNK